MDTTPVDPQHAPGDASRAPWQAFFLQAADPLEPGEGPVRTALRRAGLAAHGLTVFALRGSTEADVRPVLGDAGTIDRWLFSSPAAVRHLQRIDGSGRFGLFGGAGLLAARAVEARVFAPGPGTATTLAAAGVEPVTVPETRFDSEGLLALPALAAPLAGRLAIVSAPGGRGLLQAALAARGAMVSTLHAYRREPAAPHETELALLDAAPSPMLVASSLAALDRLPAVLPPELLARLLTDAPIVLASERLAAAARTLGFRCCQVARSALADDLAAAAAGLARLPRPSVAGDSASMKP